MKGCFLLLFVFFLIDFEISGQCYGGSPTTDDPTSYNYGLSVETNFNNARRWEESNLSLTPNCLGNMVAPPGGWGSLTDDQIALYIHDSERAARNKLPLFGVEANLDNVSQAHSDWQAVNNVFSHGGNPSLGNGMSYLNCSCTNTTGSSPSNRINQSSPLQNNWEFVSENIFVMVNFSNSFPNFVAQGMYSFIYQDVGSSWGHRLNILKDYNNNWGDAASEGFIGVGISNEPNYSNCYWSCTNYPFAQILTLNYYDPKTSASGFSFSALPLDLIAFNGKVENETVMLHWSTVNESNSDKFVIQKSENAEDFYDIGFVNCFNSKEENKYVYKDKILPDPISYYRLEAIDKNGNSNFSTIIPVNIFREMLVSVYPNPVNEKLIVDLGNIRSFGQMTLLDINGNQLYNQKIILNNSRYVFDLSGYLAGVYTLRVSVGNEIKIVKIVKTSI